MIKKLCWWLEENRIPKWLVVVAVVLIILVAVLVIINFSAGKTGKKNNTAREVWVKKTVDPASLKIAKANLDWADKNKDDRGLYVMSKMCNFSTPNECDQSLPSNRSGIPVMWARFNYYLDTGDKQELEILRQDINNYADSNKAKLIQNNNWDCKLMIDLGKSEIFSDEEKNKIEKICFDSLYEFDSYLGRMSFEKNLDSVINLEDLKGTVQKNLSIVLDRKPKDSINPQYKSTINGNATYLKQNAMYIIIPDEKNVMRM